MIFIVMSRVVSPTMVVGMSHRIGIRKEKTMSSHVSRRKQLRKSAAHRHGVTVNDLKWLNGQLVFVKNGERVPDMPEVKKPR